MVTVMREQHEKLAEPKPLRVYENVGRDLFENEIRAGGLPAVMRGLCADWDVTAAARKGPQALADYMLQYDRGEKAITYLAKPEENGRYFYSEDMRGFNFERREIGIAKTLAKLLEIAGDENPMGIYAGAGSSSDLFPGFSDANPMALLDNAVPPLVWIGNGARIAPHYDASDNIAVTVAGKRRFTLFPPAQVKNLYVGPIEFTMAGQPASMVDPAAPDLERFPKFAAAMEEALFADMQPGDAIYIPALWWHTVRSEGPFNMLVNYWWGNDNIGSGIEVLVHALLNIRDLPEHQKSGWRDLFDHYVFAGDADALTGHLPPHVHGVLGESSPARNRHIIEFLKASLSRL